MASGGELPSGEPPDKSIEIMYKCHPKQKVSTVTFIVCESAYHRSDYGKCKDRKYVGENEILMLCPDHVELNITLKNENIELSEAARILIAYIKNEKEEQIKQRILNEISIISESAHKSIDNDKLNVTILTENTELDNQQIEIQLLRQLNQELMEKNALLKKLIEKEKNEYKTELNQHNQKTYAEITANKLVSKNRRTPKL